MTGFEPRTSGFEVTALPTEPPPLPAFPLLWMNFGISFRICGPGPKFGRVQPIWCSPNPGDKWIDGKNTFIKDHQGKILQKLQAAGLAKRR